MKVIVVGSGLIGLTTAYCLARRGCEVQVLDRQPGPGLETSFANGTLLTPSMCDPWNAPGCWKVLLGSLMRSDAPLQLRFKALPSLAWWGLGFLKNSSVGRFQSNKLSNLRMALYSMRAMAALLDEINLDFKPGTRGTLRIFRETAALEHAASAGAELMPHGLSCRRLSVNETIEVEPALEPISNQLAGAMHYATDQTGDAYAFCVELTARARAAGVEFLFGEEVRTLETTRGAITAVLSGERRYVADRYVIAAGSYSVSLLAKVGVRLPMRPAKGYSVTVDSASGERPLHTPLVDDHLHAVVVPVANGVRVAGTAEFAGYDLSIQPTRIATLQQLLRDVLPRFDFDPAHARPWCGLRPMSVDGVPIIGTTPIDNLFVNTAHGHLGWTMAAGSAQLLVDQMCDRSPAIDPSPYRPARFVLAS